MGAFADLFRPSPNRRHSSSPSSKQPRSLSTLDVPLPLPQPMWALATEPGCGRTPGPRDMRTAGPEQTGSLQGRTLKKADRRGPTAESGVVPGHIGRGDTFAATGDFGMAGLSVSDSPGPSTYPPRPPYPPSTSYSTPPRPALSPSRTRNPPLYPPPPPQPTAGPSQAPLVPLNVAVNSHRSSLPFYTPPRHSSAKFAPQGTRVSPERPLPPTPPPCPPRPPSYHASPPHPVHNSQFVYAATPSSSNASPTRLQSPHAPVVPPRPPQHPYQQPSPTRLADRTNAATPPRASHKPHQKTPDCTSSPAKSKGKGKAKQPLVLDIDSSSDDSFIDDSAAYDDEGVENDSLLEELRESVFRGKKSSGKDPIKAVAARRSPISTPSPRRRRESGTPTRPGQQRQCSGITSAGRRCTRSCSPSFGTSGAVGDEGADVGFCKQHAKTALKESGCFVAGRAGGDEQWIRFSDWISESLPVETQALLRHYMSKPVSDKDEDGYIYIHELLSSPHSATLPTAHLKLGRSIHPLLRLSQHRRTNTLCPLLGEPIVRYIFPSAHESGGGVKFAQKGGRNSHRWERLCLVELAGRALSARKEEGKCRECGKRHLECFEVQRGAVAAGGAGEGEWNVKEVVQRWERWCSDVIG
ncbi:hypothetical protein OF846_001087 [Rhodotorula toruloides]|nr:hypothetical protein OF846_001087 [Rhodotorula toruloides]